MTEPFAALLRRYRVAARLTQAQLAERAGISERAVSDVERGVRSRVYPVTAGVLADALGLGPEDRPAFEAAATGRATDAGATVRPPDPWRALRRTALLGREDELDSLMALLDGGARLVTVTGAGGIGKSRLAAEAAARTAENRDVVWVEFAAVGEPGLMLATLAGALGASAGREALLPTLAAAADRRGALLVLDTFETVLASAGQLGELLDLTTRVQVLVTSRAPLRVRGEQELPVRSLPAAAAAELFSQRARAARPRLSLDDADGRALVTEICATLSGIPLALELAAARVRHLPLPALRAALEQPLGLLTDGERDLPERQRTMRAAIAWSHDLLGEPDRILFRRLGSFAGGWTLEAAQRVGAGSGPDTLAGLGRLCDQGLIHADLESAGSRWDVADPIREYAVEQALESGDAASAGMRHAEFYAELAESAATRLLGGEQQAARAGLRTETANLRAALGWSIRSEAVEPALRLVGALWMFWRMEGVFDEARSWLDRALGLPGADGSPRRAGALWGAAWLAYQRDDLAAATALGEELLRSSGDGRDLDRRNGLTILGHVAIAEHRYDEAVRRLEEALTIARANAAPWHVATSLLNLGTALLRYGDPDRAEALLSEAVAEHDAAGDRHFAARALIELGYASLLRGDLDAAADHDAEALRRFLALGEEWGIAEVFAAVGVLAAVGGRPESAAVLTGASEALYQRIATGVIAPDAALAAPFLAHARTQLGEQRWQQAGLDGARLSVQEAAELALAEVGRRA